MCVVLLWRSGELGEWCVVLLVCGIRNDGDVGCRCLCVGAELCVCVFVMVFVVCGHISCVR